MSFVPPRCPYPDCPSRTGKDTFAYWRKGFYRRQCDRRIVPRFRCRSCNRGFSRQTFRVDHRLRKPQLDVKVLELMVSKCTVRKCARNLGVRRETVERRVIRFGIHAQQLNQWLLDPNRVRVMPHESFSLDELESFETDRKLMPVTVPILIERTSRFLLHGEVAPLPARKPLSKRENARLARIEQEHGVRESGSYRAVRETFERLLERIPEGELKVVTDKKPSYHTTLIALFGSRVNHVQVSSKALRNESNPLFPINHTLAMARDCVAKLVRRNWAHAKLASRLELHLWIWIAFKNLVRPRFVTKRRIDRTPAELLGLARERWSSARLIRWRVWGLH